MAVEDLMGPIIATREMSWLRADGVACPAIVEIGMPYHTGQTPAEPPGLWGCRVRARGLGDNNHYAIYGVDAIEALYLGLCMAGTIVKNSIVANDLDWAAAPNFGFPLEPEQGEAGAGGDCGCDGGGGGVVPDAP